MDAVMQWLGNEDVLAFVVTLATGAWTLFKALAVRSEWAGRIKDTEFESAVTLIASAAESVGVRMTDSLRAKSADGELSPTDWANVRAEIRGVVLSLAKEQGVQVAKILGTQGINYWIDLVEQWRVSPAGTSLGVTLPHSGEEIKAPAMKF